MAPFDSEVQSGAICAIVASPLTTAERTYGLAVFDEDRRCFQICEYIEDAHASRSEALLLQLMPRSLVASITDTEGYKRLGRVAESCGVPLSAVRAVEASKQVDLEQDLQRLLKDTEGCGLSRHLEEQSRKQGMRALSVLIGHHNLLSEPSYSSACTLSLYPLRSFLYLDKAAFSALNVLPRPEESVRSTTSLLGFLNRCKTPLGIRKLRQWITQPLTSAEEISARHNIVEALAAADGLLRQLEGHLRKIPDLERIATRFLRTPTKTGAQKASLEDLVVVYQSILEGDKLLSALRSYDGPQKEVVHQTVTSKVETCLADFQNYRALVEQVVDLDQVDQRVYCIAKSFNAELAQLGERRDAIRNEMEVVRANVESAVKLPVRNSNERPVSLVDCSDGRALRVTKKHQQAVQHFKGKPQLKVLSLKKMEVVFTTPELEKLNKQYKEALAAYDQHSSQLVNKALSVASTYGQVMERMGEVIGTLDVLASFARVVLTAPCGFARAKIDESGKEFKIDGATHILVVANADKSFVANNLEMDKDSSRLHLITGPNMGGKSTYIRSVALIVLMNQIGCFVPCRSAVLPVFDSVMCRVGASDMQLRGISTFMAEMLEASCILNTATERSLVIIDELGRGTSTSDGFGIAWSIAQHLVQTTKCYSLFATHFHELAALEDAVGGVKNRHATATVCPASGQLTFLYSLADGAADQSYGAHVAELAGFPEHVVAAARVKAEELEQSSCPLERPAKRARTEGEGV
uniref:DNA mismatch repair protein MSH2 n=1 Tax=Crypthecodinium cohnii TaxID=2866 RepID=A0A516AGM3_CRYCO|nr:DNA mismatch repair protein MSH2 [Crypthecodinium cohnii]USW07880.1 DNA mismatch repair protein MSH2 [Crypthecodinium cohnii]